MPNPFIQKPGRSKTRPLKSAPKVGSTPTNPWSARVDGNSANRSTSQKISTSNSSRRPTLAKSGRTKPRRGPSVGRDCVGETVRITWAVDPAFGMGPGEFVGEVTDVNDWVTAVDNKGTIFHYPTAVVRSIDTIEDNGRAKATTDG